MVPDRTRDRWVLADLFLSFLRWFDASVGIHNLSHMGPPRVDWFRCLPFVAMHAMCLAVIWVGWSWTAVSVTIALYGIRMFAITGFYHRYFSHRAFKTFRGVQFAFAVLGASAVQRGPLWWAAHHRHHHLHSDQQDDAHSPRHRGFLWSHMGWFTSRSHFATNISAVPDLAKFPELRFLDRFDVLVPIAFGALLYAVGTVLGATVPALGTNGPQMLIWGFFVSTVVLFHGTNTINSLGHVIGRKRYETGDDSRNSLLLAFITLGEGWHNNHHHYPASARQGFYWWEVDPTYYGLVLLSWTGLIWDLKPVPERIRNGQRVEAAATLRNHVGAAGPS